VVPDCKTLRVRSGFGGQRFLKYVLLCNAVAIESQVFLFTTQTLS
jgi:hypothetical protein